METKSRQAMEDENKVKNEKSSTTTWQLKEGYPEVKVTDCIHEAPSKQFLLRCTI